MKNNSSSITTNVTTYDFSIAKVLKLLIVSTLIFTFILTATSCKKDDKDTGNETVKDAGTTNVTTEEKTSSTSTTASKTDSNIITTTTTKKQSTANAVQNITVDCKSVSANGKLLTACAANSAGGSNQSPALTFTAVDSAKSYAIYMIDTSAGNWLHWLAYSVTSTNLSQGVQLSNSKYKGPYPPSGSHTYVIYVFALADNASTYPGNFDAKNSSIDKIKSTLDKNASGATGNVIGMGSTTVSYANGDNNV